MALASNVNKQRKAAGVEETNVRYNSRTAQANATVQDTNANTQNLEKQQDTIQKQRADLLAAHAAGTVSDDEYNRQNSNLTNSAHRVGAALQTNAGVAAPAQSHLNEAGQVYDAEAERNASQGNGAISASAYQRIKDQHPEWTDAQINEQMGSSKEEAMHTMSNTGHDTGVDPAVIGRAGQAFRTNNAKKNADAAKAATEKRISGIKGYKTLVKVDEYGNEYTVTEIDEGETNRLQQEARTAAEAKAAADANYAAERNAATGDETGAPIDSDTIDPNPDAFLGSLDAMERAYAGSAMAPLFDFYKEQYKQAQAKGLRGEQLMAAVQEKTDAYVAQQRADMKSMENSWSSIYDDQLRGQLDSAARTYDQSQRLAEQQKEKDQITYDRAIRDQNIKNEEDRQSLLLGNGISAGWRSSMHTSKMIDAFKKAELIVSDMSEDKLANAKEWTNKLIDIEQTYHGNITAAYDAYNVNLITLQDKLSERARDIDKTIYSNDVNQLNTISKLTEEWYDSVGEIANAATATVVQIQKDTIEAKKQATIDFRQQQRDFRSDYQWHIGAFGNSDPTGYAQLVDQANALGIKIPSTAPETLEQKSAALKSVTAGIGAQRMYTPHIENGVDLSSAARNVINRLSPDKQPGVADDIFTALESGNINEFMNKAISNGLEGLSAGTQNDYKASIAGLSNTSTAVQMMSGIESTNIYKRIYNDNIRTALAQNKDQPWLAALGTSQLATAELVNDLIGASQSDNERASLAQFLPASGDTVQDTITKLRTAHSYFQRKYDTAATMALGGGYGWAVKNGQVVNFAGDQEQPTSDYDNDDPGLQSSTGGSGVGSTLSMDSTVANPSMMADSMMPKQGIYDWAGGVGKLTAGYDSDHIHIGLSDNGRHGGIDLAGKMGQEIKPYIGGKVVSVSGSASDKKGYGLSVTIKDNNGVFWKYSHLSEVPKEIRDALARGEQPTITPDMMLAKMGNSGNVIASKGGTGVHLDLRARRADGKWIRIEDEYAMPPNIASNTPKKNA